MYANVDLFIDGEVISGGGRVAQPVVDPATATEIGKVTLGNDADIAAAIAAASRAFPAWSTRPPIERSAILRKAADLLRERADSLAALLTLEQGKPLAQARGEILAAAMIYEWNAEEGRRAYGRVVPNGAAGASKIVTMEPVGVAVALTPWNFPALTPARKIAAALAAGCTLVLKASEETPATAAALVRSLHEAGLPAGVLNLVFGEPARVSEQMIANPAVRKLSFTGSVPVGRHLAQAAGERLIRTTMELGGHAPVIVFEDADAEQVARLTAATKFANAGQVCISPNRFYVHDRHYDRFVEAFAAEAAALRVGSGLDDGVTMGPLANARRVEAMEALVADASTAGAKIVTGGQRLGNAGFFFAPTVLADVPDTARIMRDEPFGPVVPITRFSSDDEVIARSNALPFGLSAYAFTDSASRAARVGRTLKAGMVGINTLGVSTPETPFGGVRDSGWGQEGGTEGLAAYMDVKLVVQA